MPGRRNKNERIAWGLNFGKEYLEDFKTSRLFQGTDLGSARKDINILRDFDDRDHGKDEASLLGEYGVLVAGCGESDSKEVQVLEEVIEDIWDEYETAPEDMALTDCNSQSMITGEDNTIDCDDDAF
ncbi:hypothetical protein BGZ95_008965 [Linnemannia exigua]|uniref:Uncharacterized protein n=1 Tax=Linnemannia exigua TaxID=604196 RepID=A0AAD4H7F3_9FUNG|nr:hypothetical protein BGZ95_008965 [Linnemannia exigua]